MARARTKRISQAQKLTGYGIVAVLGLITIWLLVQQSRFNPAVTAVLQAPGPGGRTQAGAGRNGRPHPGSSRIYARGCRPKLRPGKPLRQDQRQGRALPVRGFQRKSCRSFTLENPKGGHLEVFVYDMGEAQNAYAVFSSSAGPGPGH